MKTLEWNTIDKSQWTKGPWQNEPDKKQWPDAETGLPCLIVRHRFLGHLCGYVGITKSHPDFNKDYDEVGVDVHGGLIYSSHCGGEVCHIVEPGEDDNVWWLGFDCAHLGDHSPAGRLPFGDDTYKDFSYVQTQVSGMPLSLAVKLWPTLRASDGAKRVDRIRALGNAVVPLQARTAFKILMGLEQ